MGRCGWEGGVVMGSRGTVMEGEDRVGEEGTERGEGRMIGRKGQ